MWTRTIHGVALVAVALTFSFHARAAFTAPPNGARPMGIGGAFTAVSDDGNAAMFNPAGFAGSDDIQAAFTRAALFSGIDSALVAHDVALLVAPLGRGGIGVGATTLSESTGVYRETSALIGYGAAIGEKLKVGALAKWVRAGVDDATPDVSQNPYFAETTSVSSVTADIGAMTEPVEGWTVGVSGQNLLPADLSFQNVEGVEADEAPMTLRFGTAYRLSAIAASAEQEALKNALERSLIAADIAVGDGTAVGIGAEIGVSSSLIARVGYRTASGYGGSVGALTFGGSVALNIGSARASVDFGIDMANSELQDNMSQRVSLRLGF